MTEAFRIKLEGLEQLTKNFESLTQKIQTRYARRAVKKGAQLIHQAAVGNVPVGNTGDLADSIKIRTGQFDKFTFEAVVAVDKFYGHFVEYGHAITRGRGSRAKTFGFSKARPFLRPAFDSNAERSLSAMATSIGLSLIHI